MGWTSGDFEGRLTAQAAINFVLGTEFAAQVLDAVRNRDVVYAAVRSDDGNEVWGLVLVIKRDGRRLHIKPISEDMGPYDDRCPARILDLLTEPSNDWARQWRSRCGARLTSTSDTTHSS
jgi:hypothetical protein